MLSVAFTGVDHIDLEACKKRVSRFCNAAGYSTEAVAELTIGMMIAVYRKNGRRRCHSPYRRRPAGSPGKRTSRKNSRYRRARSHWPTGSSVSQRFRMQGLGYNRSPKALPHIHPGGQRYPSASIGYHYGKSPLNPETKAFIRDKRICTHATMLSDPHRQGPSSTRKRFTMP